MRVNAFRRRNRMAPVGGGQSWSAGVSPGAPARCGNPDFSMTLICRRFHSYFNAEDAECLHKDVRMPNERAR
jgi:hypothetical protein